jgi:hypothetical protein
VCTRSYGYLRAAASTPFKQRCNRYMLEYG